MYECLWYTKHVASKKPGLTCGVPTLNEEDNILRTLNSLEERLSELHSDWDYEIVVADGGSTDKTREICRNHSLVEKVGVVDEDGIMYGRDSVHQMAQYKLVAHCDADTKYTKHYFNKMLRHFSDPEVAMVHGNVKGEGMEKGLRELYASGMRVVGGKYAPGQARMLRHSAYKQTGCDWSVNQDSGPRTSWEEEVKFPNRVEQQVGDVVYEKQAVVYTSGRNIESIVKPGTSKNGGKQWKETG